MIKTVVKVILIIAVVGSCVYGFLAERAEKAEAEFSGTATYSGTYITDNPPPGSRFRIFPDFSGTCEVTFDFDAGTVSMSLAGDLSGTVRGRASKYPSGYRYGDFRIPPGGASGRIKIRHAGRIYEYVLLVSGGVPNEDRSKAGGSWLLRSRDPSVLPSWNWERIPGSWKAQKVPTP